MMNEDIEETVRQARAEAIRTNERNRIAGLLDQVEDDMKAWCMLIGQDDLPPMPHEDFPKSLAGIGKWIKDGAVIEDKAPA